MYAIIDPDTKRLCGLLEQATETKNERYEIVKVEISPEQLLEISKNNIWNYTYKNGLIYPQLKNDRQQIAELYSRYINKYLAPKVSELGIFDCEEETRESISVDYADLFWFKTVMQDPNASAEELLMIKGALGKRLESKGEKL